MPSEENQISNILRKLNTFMACPSIQKLIEMKEAVGRPEDREDVRKLRQILVKLEKKYYE